MKKQHALLLFPLLAIASGAHAAMDFSAAEEVTTNIAAGGVIALGAVLAIFGVRKVISLFGR